MVDDNVIMSMIILIHIPYYDNMINGCKFLNKQLKYNDVSIPSMY